MRCGYWSFLRGTGSGEKLHSPVLAASRSLEKTPLPSLSHSQVTIHQAYRPFAITHSLFSFSNCQDGICCAVGMRDPISKGAKLVKFFPTRGC